MTSGTLAKRGCLFIIALVFLCIFISRLPYIDQPPVEMGDYWRQPDTESIARNFVQYRFNIFYPQVNYDGVRPNYVQLEPQITTFLIAILYKLFGFHFWLARLVPIVFFMFSVYFLYRIAKRFFSFPQALTVIILYSLLPLNIFFSRAVMPEAALLCFFNGAFYFFLQWLDDERLSTLTAAAVLTCLAISQKPQVVFMGLAMIALCLEKFKYRVGKQWSLWLFAALALLPNAVYFLWSGTMAQQKFVTGIAQKHIFPRLFTDVFTPEAWQFFAQAFPEAFSLPVLLLAALGLFTVLKKKERPLLYWALAMLLEAMLIVSVIKFKYYLIMLTPILALLSGKLLGRLWDRSYPGKMLLLFFLLLIAKDSYDSTQKDFTVRNVVIEGAKIINTYTKPEDLIVIGTYDPGILSLSDRTGWRANLKYYDFIPTEIDQEMNYLITHGADYFLVHENYIYNDNGSYIQYLDAHFGKKAYGQGFVLYQLSAREPGDTP